AIAADDRLVAAALSNLGSTALAVAMMYEAESASRLAAELAEHRSEFLAKAGAALAGSLDDEAALKTIAALAVPEMADWCAVDLVKDDGSIERLAIAHRDPGRAPLVEELQSRYPPDPRSPYGVHEVIRRKAPVMVELVSDDLLLADARDAEHLRLVRELGLTSYMCVPLLVRGRVAAALTFVSAESGRGYTASDLKLAEEVAARAALAIENARAYAEARAA